MSDIGNLTKSTLSQFIGPTWKLPISVLDPATLLPLDLTGGSIRMRIADTTAMYLDITLNASTGNFTLGKATIYLAPQSQTSLIAGVFNFEIQSLDTNGNIFTQSYGAIKLTLSLFTQYTAGGTLDFSSSQQSALIGH